LGANWHAVTVWPEAMSLRHTGKGAACLAMFSAVRGMLRISRYPQAARFALHGSIFALSYTGRRCRLMPGLMPIK
jgi:hypothetical protein